MQQLAAAVTVPSSLRRQLTQYLTIITLWKQAVSGQVCSQFPCQFRTNCQILKLIYLEKLFIEKSASHDEGSLKYLLSGGVTLDTVILGKNKGQASARGIRRPDTTEALRIALTRRMSEHFINLAK